MRKNPSSAPAPMRREVPIRLFRFDRSQLRSAKAMWVTPSAETSTMYRRSSLGRTPEGELLASACATACSSTSSETSTLSRKWRAATELSSFSAAQKTGIIMNCRSSPRFLRASCR